MLARPAPWHHQIQTDVVTTSVSDELVVTTSVLVNTNEEDDRKTRDMEKKQEEAAWEWRRITHAVAHTDDMRTC